jgi:hypothetical protein
MMPLAISYFTQRRDQVSVPAKTHGGGITHPLSDQPLDRVVRLKLFTLPKRAVVETPHQGAVWVSNLPRVANDVNPHHVFEIEREERLTL